jgi:hypothetical protein
MRDIRNRNAEILNMRKMGLSFGEIAHIFDISRERVHQILQEADLEQKRKQRAEKIFQDMRLSNNIEKTWPIEVIIEFLLLPKTVMWRLLRYFEVENISQLTLKDFMDLLIVNNGRMPRDFREAFPICNVRRIGPWTHSVIVDYLSRQDLGAAFSKEWTKRLEKLAIYVEQTREHFPEFFCSFSYPQIYNGSEKPDYPVSPH